MYYYLNITQNLSICLNNEMHNVLFDNIKTKEKYNWCLNVNANDCIQILSVQTVKILQQNLLNDYNGQLMQQHLKVTLVHLY